jgi:hypothetical protein
MVQLAAALGDPAAPADGDDGDDPVDLDDP